LRDVGVATATVVGTAVTADEALEIARAKEPDIAIMDIRLGGARDGIDAAIALIQELGISSIFASAHGDRTTRERAEAARPLGFLEKPYSPAALLSAVRSALGKEI
jgi:two-component system, response regulator PdtaR